MLARLARPREREGPTVHRKDTACEIACYYAKAAGGAPREMRRYFLGGGIFVHTYRAHIIRRARSPPRESSRCNEARSPLPLSQPWDSFGALPGSGPAPSSLKVTRAGSLTATRDRVPLDRLDVTSDNWRSRGEEFSPSGPFSRELSLSLFPSGWKSGFNGAATDTLLRSNALCALIDGGGGGGGLSSLLSVYILRVTY